LSLCQRYAGIAKRFSRKKNESDYLPHTNLVCRIYHYSKQQIEFSNPYQWLKKFVILKPTMFDKIIQKFNNPWLRLCILVALSALISFQNYVVKPAPNGQPYQELTLYSNFLIFKNSFFHLLSHQDLYQSYLSERVDLYKYSPAFALLMAPFAVFPDLVGLFLWNFLNVFVLYMAIWQLPIVPLKNRLLALLLILLEAITAMQNSQSNGLIAGLIILAFTALEKNRSSLATLFLVATVFIKIFGLLAFVMFLFYPNKFKNFAYSLFWALTFLLLPLLVTSPEELFVVYQSWWRLLSTDYSISEGLSVMAWLHTWFGIENVKLTVVSIGLLVFSLPLLRFKLYTSRQFRELFLCSILIWVIIFNHKAESPTFVIAVSGIVIWFFSQTQSLFNRILLGLTLVFTILAPVDIFPAYVRNEIFIPYAVKVVPCFLVWMKLTFDLLTMKDIETAKAAN
jgi:hypothetical protein